MQERLESGDMVLSIFDSFCKTVLRNKARDINRERRSGNQISIVSLDDAEEMAFLDRYPSNEQCITVNNMTFCIEDEKLYLSMLELPEREMHSLLLHFWEGWKDQALASHFHLTTRTVRNWRHHSLGLLRKTLLEKGWRPSESRWCREQTGNHPPCNSREARSP